MKNPSISNIMFWKGICANLPLSSVAVAILEMPPSSAATERTFSTQGGIHSKSRNRLTTDNASKITYVKMNTKLSREMAETTPKAPKQKGMQIHRYYRACKKTFYFSNI